MTPDELMYQTGSHYNEILLLERGRESTDMDVSIPQLEKIALYCVDEIRRQDIEVAKQNGVGIFLVDSSKYNKGIDMPKGIYRHNIDVWNENYFELYKKEEFKAKR